MNMTHAGISTFQNFDFLNWSFKFPTFSFPGGWITIVLGSTTVWEKETKNISSSFSCEHSFDSYIYPSQFWFFCHKHWYPFFFHASYVGILSGYAISLVAWSWYTECADCPKVTISQSEWRQKSFCPNYDSIDQLEWRRLTRSVLKLVLHETDAHRTSDWNSQEFSIQSYSSWSR